MGSSSIWDFFCATLHDISVRFSVVICSKALKTDYACRRIFGYHSDPGAVPGSSTNENAQLPSGMLGVFVAKGYFYKVKQPPASSGCFGSGVFWVLFLFLAPVKCWITFLFRSYPYNKPWKRLCQQFSELCISKKYYNKWPFLWITYLSIMGTTIHSVGILVATLF